MKRIGILVLLILIISTVYSVDNIYFDADRASNYLGIPSPYTSEVNNEIVHPDVIYEPEGWNGYKYWMVFTPFPNSEPQYENPCIVVSQDGLTWSVPTGLTNPVVAVDLIPANYDYQYYSDPDFILSSDKATMYLSWRYKHGWVDEELLVITSTDGINWSTETLVLSTNENFEKLISPAIIYNDAQYELFTVNSTVSPRKYYRRTAGTPLGPWVNRTELNFPLYNGESWILSDQVAGASMVWHWNMIYEEGEYWMIGAVGPATTSSGGSLWIAKSTDGLNWVFDNNPLFDIGTSGWDKGIYQSAAIPYYENEVMNLKIWYSSDGNYEDWHIGYTIAYSPDDPVLSVQMSAFYAIYADYRNNINIQWSTESETNVLGFNVFSHSNRDFSQAEMKNGLMIPAENSNQGANYTFVDEHPLDTEDVFYWLEMVSFSGESELYGPTKTSGQDNNGSDNSHGLESGFVGAYPNPFNPQTELAFNLASSSPVTIQVFNIKGELVWEYEPGVLSEGHHTVVFDATKAIGAGSSGIYICKYKDSINTVIKKLVLLK